MRPRSKDSLHCGPVKLPELAAKWGTPLYVYSADAILARFRMFARAFADQPHLVCYSVKANSSLAILKLLADQGAGFDIVSGGELERVLAVKKAAAARVVFSGVGKTAPELDLALRSGIRIFNVESEGELELLAERAAKQRRKARFALRVNPDVFAETHPYISTGLSAHKFGIAISEARALYARARGMRWLEASGVSVHIGSQIREAGPFGAAAERVAALAAELEQDGDHLRSLDLGGGLGIEYDEGTSWDPEARVLEYATTLRGSLGSLGGRLELLLEPGRFLVAQAGALLTEVLYTKQNGAKRFVITDAGMNDLIRPSLYGAHHAIEPVAAPRREQKTAVVDVVGPVCESGDFFARDRELAAVEAGDLLAILDAGAYGMSLASNYNTRPRPAEVMIEGKKARLVRKRESIADLLKMERV
ncbi:diaminopimelate decarboxylase [Acidipila sp. EB88]|uniref:diaminopimelate decarboxylase n=1 Tax=Acidipila sp. EB88 TaxID=2305226 RepID=UPI0021079C1C|nr:diaminopimelate decarboxylase [Acidipila sp. EB88]